MIAASRRAFLASLAAVGTIPAALPMVGDTPISPGVPDPTPDLIDPGPFHVSIPKHGNYTVTEVTEYTTHDRRRIDQYTFEPDGGGPLWHTEFEVSQWSWRVVDRVRISEAYRADGAAMFWYVNLPKGGGGEEGNEWCMEIKREDGLQ